MHLSVEKENLKHLQREKMKCVFDDINKINLRSSINSTWSLK